MKTLITFIAFCFLSIAVSAQVSSDSTTTTPARHSMYDSKVSKANDHLHPKVKNIGNPSGGEYDIDGAVFRNDAIVNRHVTNINDLVR